jgi:glycosyltransferase involved in cell wall biosynthesis
MESLKQKKIAVIAVSSPSGERGGAERFYEGLARALTQGNIKAEVVPVVSDESCFESIEETYLRFYDLDLLAYDGVISTKAPAYLVRHPNHICYLQHTMRVFYDMFDYEFPHPTEELLRQQELIHQLDTGALKYPRTRKVFVIGHEVKNRLLKYNHIESEVLYQGLTLDDFHCKSYEYIFMPGRLHQWKRVELIIEAMKYVKSPLELRIAGTGHKEEYLRQKASSDKRIIFHGHVSENELVELYSEALVIPFVPIREDFGLITLEAFRSHKPVITCEDSGEPAYIVRDSETGFICPANPRIIASKFDFFYNNPQAAQAMGIRGAQSINYITWTNVAEKLLSTLIT